MDANPYREALQALPFGAYMTDADGWITFFNKAAVDLCGRVPRIGEDRWCVTWRLFWPDGRPMPHAACPMAVALAENRPVRGAEAIAERPDGTRFRFTPYPTPLYDERGALKGGMNVLLDLPEAGAPRALHQMLEQEQTLRVEVILSLIRAVVLEVQRQAMKTGLRGRPFQQIIQSINAISVAHGLFHAADPEASVDAWDLLSATSILARPAIGADVEVRCVSSAGDVPIDKALPLALLVRELLLGLGAAGSTKREVQIGLSRDRHDYVLVAEGAQWHAHPAIAGATRWSGLFAALLRQLDGVIEADPASVERLVVRLPHGRTYN